MKPEQDQGNQQSGMERGRVHETSPLTEELLAVEGLWLVGQKKKKKKERWHEVRGWEGGGAGNS